jgi:hypothetical protein
MFAAVSASIANKGSTQCFYNTSKVGDRLAGLMAGCFDHARQDAGNGVGRYGCFGMSHAALKNELMYQVNNISPGVVA